MTTVLTCPRCGHSYTTGVTFQNVTFVGNAMNIVVPCPRCGLEFDATGGGDGTFSEVGGRLRRVSRILAGADRDTLSELHERLDLARRTNDAAAAAAALRDAGVEAPAWASQANRMELWAVLSMIATVITLILALKGSTSTTITPEQVEEIIREVQRPPASDRSDARPGRNDRCPCGSGAKFKKCHGAHPTLRRADDREPD